MLESSRGIASILLFDFVCRGVTCLGVGVPRPKSLESDFVLGLVAGATLLQHWALIVSLRFRVLADLHGQVGIVYVPRIRRLQYRCPVLHEKRKKRRGSSRY